MFAASKTAAAAAGTPPPSTDPQFNYVTMLLHGDGTNGAQNNTFVDSSTNNFTITRNGTPTQGSFSPYGDLWSNQFSGTVGNYVSVPDNAGFQFGSGDFTIEGWMYLNSLTASSYFLGKGDRASVAGSAFSLPLTNYTMDFYAGSSVFSLSTFTPTLNTWFHIAIVRNGTTITRYINGVSNASVTIGTASINTGGTNEVRIGGYVNSTGFLGINGYLSNLRIVKGTALYTSVFTPSTTPLTAVSGTSLLTCQSNRFRDASSNNFAITVTGTPSVQRFSPFDPAAEYSTSVIGGSGFFGTSGQSVQAASNAAFTFGTGDFTVEYFVYATSWSSSPTIVDLRSSNPSFGGYADYYSTAGKFNLYWATTTVYTSAATLGLNQWHHIAVSRSGSTVRVFVNGVLDGTFTNAFNFTDSNCRIGANTNTTPAGIVGYLSGARIVKGTAVYTAAFTPPTAPLTAITNTSLLLNTVNAGIFDNAMMNDLVTVGNAQASTAVKKYGTGSIVFDGTGDCLTTPDVGLFDFGTGDFTVETWLYPTVFITDGNSIASGLGPTNGDWMMALRSSTQLSWGRNHLAWDATTSGVTFSLNTWYHVAVTKSSGTLRIFVDGVQRASVSNSQSYNVQTSLAVGARQATFSVFGPGEFFNGYIDDLRITKGIARYTANFTPPTAALPNN